MTDPFSVISGTVGIGAAFSACVDCFMYIQFGRHFARDFHTNLVTLNCIKLRLMRWGKAVDIVNDPRLGNPRATEAEIQAAEQILHQILRLFAETRKVSKRHLSDAKFGEDLSICSQDESDSTLMVLNRKLGELADKLWKKPDILRVASWALYDRANFADLIEGLTGLMENLEKLFPATEARLELARQEVLELSRIRSITQLQNLPCQTDTTLRSAINEVVSGHRYTNTIIKGRAQTGDQFGADWTAGSIGASHVYDGTLIEADARVLMGNAYGGRGFWED